MRLSTSALHLAPFRDTCRSCRKPIAWTVTTSGKPMPVDYEPDPERGNVLLTIHNGQLLAGVLNRNQAAGARDRGERVHTSHFARCPHADTHRKAKR